MALNEKEVGVLLEMIKPAYERLDQKNAEIETDQVNKEDQSTDIESEIPSDSSRTQMLDLRTRQVRMYRKQIHDRAETPEADFNTWVKETRDFMNEILPLIDEI